MSYCIMYVKACMSSNAFSKSNHYQLSSIYSGQRPNNFVGSIHKTSLSDLFLTMSWFIYDTFNYIYFLSNFRLLEIWNSGKINISSLGKASFADVFSVSLLQKAGNILNFCNETVKLNGSVPIAAIAGLTYSNSTLTSVALSTTGQHTVAFVGTGEGLLKKVI